jgi:hypothetical protein
MSSMLLFWGCTTWYKAVQILTDTIGCLILNFCIYSSTTVSPTQQYDIPHTWIHHRHLPHDECQKSHAWFMKIHAYMCNRVFKCDVCFCVCILFTYSKWVIVCVLRVNKYAVSIEDIQAIIWRASSLDCKGLFSLSSPTCISLSPALI